MAEMTMVERVARALCKCHGVVDHSPIGWQWYLPMARAAIEAMREPDDDMVLAGILAWEKSPMAVKTQFTAMIDATLKEPAN